MVWHGAPRFTRGEESRCLSAEEFICNDDPRHNTIVELVNRLFDAPAIIFILTKFDGQVVASCGMPKQTLSRRTSFCAWSLVPPRAEILVVTDTLKDPRFAENPIVIGPPHLRFYIGAPIIVAGQRVGSLCCLDTKPKTVSAHDLATLGCLAHILSNQNLPYALCSKVDTIGFKLMCQNDTFRSRYNLQEGDIVEQNGLTIALPISPHIIKFQKPSFPKQCDTVTLCSGPNMHMPSHIGVVIPDLTIHDLIGKGPHGVVHTGYLHGKVAAVKLMHMNTMLSHPTTASVHHSHLNSVWQCYVVRSTQSDLPHGVVVMPLCCGSLTQLIEEGYFRSKCSFFNGSVNLNEVLRFAMQLAEGMLHLHQHGIVHGNLHSNNILVNDQKDCLISDYQGMEMMCAAGTDVIHKSPECLQDGLMTEKSDVYAFGIALWEMMTSRRVWGGLHADDVIVMKSHNNAQLVFPQNMPEDLKDFGQSCLHEDFNQRPNFTEIVMKVKQFRESFKTTVVPDFDVYG